MRLPLAILFAPVVLATALACSGGAGESRATAPTGPTGPATLPGQSGPAALASCGTNTTPFSVSPVAMADILGWVPLGNLGPPGHLFPTDHQYLYVNHPEIPSTVRHVNVASPGNITITQVHRTHYSASNTYDYAIEFQPCAELFGSFGHVTTIVPALLDKLGPFDQNCAAETSNPLNIFTNCFTKIIAVTVSAGEAIGTTAGQGTSFALDFSLHDRRVTPLVFANPVRWPVNTMGPDRGHTVAASAYFAEPARSAIRAKLGTFDGATLRTIEPVDGTIGYDVPGTAQGVWVNAAQPTSPESPHVALVPHNVDPTRMAVSMGTSQPAFDPGLYLFTPTSSGTINRNPSQVTADGTTYCFQFGQQQGVLLVRLDDATTLRAEGRKGAFTTCATESPFAFTSASFTYKR